MPCLLFSPIGEALVFVREPQHLVFGQPVMHLVPEGADFPGSVTPTLLLAVVGLHSANPYTPPVGDSVMAVTDGRRRKRLGDWPEDGNGEYAPAMKRGQGLVGAGPAIWLRKELPINVL
jgi:hypothetical protein